MVNYIQILWVGSINTNIFKFIIITDKESIS
nr:MAG TPA: hypothetical protein [Caudoviricetes sp.]